MMNLKTILGASAIAMMLPFAASAATVLPLVEGAAGNNVINEDTVDDFWLYEFNGTDSDSFDGALLQFNFENDLTTSITLEVSTTASINPDATASGGALGGFGAPEDAVISIPDDGAQDFFATLGAADGGSDTVTFFVRLGDVEPLYQLDITVSTAPVPVPAAGFLLLGGLGGLAMMRRRKKS